MAFLPNMNLLKTPVPRSSIQTCWPARWTATRRPSGENAGLSSCPVTGSPTGVISLPDRSNHTNCLTPPPCACAVDDRACGRRRQRHNPSVRRSIRSPETDSQSIGVEPDRSFARTASPAARRANARWRRRQQGYQGLHRAGAASPIRRADRCRCRYLR